MNKRTRTALEGSIKKWENIVALKGGDNGVVNCPLCQEFYAGPEDGESCDACPIR